MNMPAEIILASASEARHRLLASAGIKIRSLASGLDETALKVQFQNSGEHAAYRQIGALAQVIKEPVGHRWLIGILVVVQ